MYKQLDTTDWVDPDAVYGNDMVGRIALEAYLLKVDEVGEAQHKQYAQLFSDAEGSDSDYMVHDSLLYSIKRVRVASSWYPHILLLAEFRENVIDRCHKNVGHLATTKTLNQVQEA